MVTLVVGALIGKLADIIAQIPACGNTLPDAVPGLEAFTLLGNVFESGDVSGTPENTIGPIPVVSSDQANAPSLLKPIQAYRWFIEHGGRHGSGWQNLVTRARPETGGPFPPVLAAQYIFAQRLMIIGKNDEMEHCAPDIQHAVFELIPANKRLCQFDKGHFGLLDPLSSEFEKSATVQVNVLREILACNQHHASSTIQKLCCPHSETFGERLMRGSISVMAQPPVPYDAYEKADMVFGSMRHLPLLAQKVGAVDQAVPLKGWDLPDEFATRHCQPAGKRDYVQILHLGFLPIWVAMKGKLVRNHEK